MGRRSAAELGVAAAAFAGLCAAVLTRSAHLLEPDDLAYRASIVALSHGHLTLSGTEYRALARQLGGIQQWVQLPGGHWISEKNPGYPFLALPFQLLGVLRAAPLFYGALGCAGLFFGGRKWLGRFGGAWAVALYCTSGAALVFAWRPTMPTFTDASLVAAGAGALLWTVLATDAPRRRRTLAGLAGFLALEAATFARYTNALALGVAVVAVLAAARPARLAPRSLACWLASVAAFGGLVAAFDATVYGGVAKTGYASGEIAFGLGAVVPNLEHMPRHLLWSMPALVPAAAALLWIGVRLVRGAAGGRRDAAVAAALAAVWLGVYGLYLAYTWTVRMSSGGGATVHVVRFYVPALGAVALLAAWLVQRLPRWTPILAVAALVALGGVAYPGLAGGGLPRGGLPGGGFGGAPPPGLQAGPPPGGAPPGQQPPTR